MRWWWVIPVACGGGDGLPQATIQLDGKALTVEIASTADQRARGLMFRDSMPADHGMIFVYTDDDERSFWMRDTRIPLSIAFLDRAGRVIHIADMQPLSTRGVPSHGAARYAVEVNQGWFASHGVEVGDKVEGLDALPR
ncbi:MAG TPA: DUF192 domain-containing protein [Myxococcota bacterium]|nr:DUF192 domain-containing protein [Myxococcota bacterium]